VPSSPTTGPYPREGRLTPQIVLRELRAAGVTALPADGKLRCVGPFPEALGPQVREHKDGLLAILREESETFRAILGRAGTGKTFMVRQQAENDPSIALTATTGIAAVNLGAMTLHALLRYYDTTSLRRKYESRKLHTRLRQLARTGLTTIVIDEVSMLDGHQLTMLVRAIDTVNSVGRHRLRLVLAGDLCQLPPVRAPFAFESPEWPRFAAGTEILREIRRQSDRDFIDALGAARCGDGPRAVEFFRPFLHKDCDPHFDGTTILARNASVDAHNRLRLAELPGPSMTFRAKRFGRQRPEWLREIPETLTLKEGAVVMTLANRRVDPDSNEFVYANGDLGVLVGRQGTDALVRLHRTGEVVSVLPVLRQHDEPGPDGKSRTLDGFISYMPLRCAYATTCFKSQGLTLDRCQIDLRDPFMGFPGSLYVALSRVRTPAGLRLVGSPADFVARCNADQRVRRWM
jgi:ATP-dependent DNA helicase PIF1